MAQTTFSGPIKSTAGFNGNALTTGAGTGITSGTDTVITSQIMKVGNIITTYIFIDIDGLEGSTTDLDIIGVNDDDDCNLGRITLADCGAIFGGSMACVETPVGGADDLDLYSTADGTGGENDIVTSEDTDVALVTAGAAWVVSTAPRPFTLCPAAGDYLYLVNGEGSSAAAFTAGKFLIELYGYEA